jgi:hypothetical protein
VVEAEREDQALVEVALRERRARGHGVLVRAQAFEELLARDLGLAAAHAGAQEERCDESEQERAGSGHGSVLRAAA